MLWKLGIIAGYLNAFLMKKFGKAQEFECQEKAKKLVENSKIMLMFKPHCSFQQFRHVKENISFPSVFAHYSNNIKVLLYPNISTFLNPQHARRVLHMLVRPSVCPSTCPSVSQSETAVSLNLFVIFFWNFAQYYLTRIEEKS